MSKEIDIHGYDLRYFLIESGVLFQEIKRNALDELPEVLHHYNVEEFLFAPEIIVQKGQVDACFVGDVAGTGGGEAFLGKEFSGGFFDLFFGGGFFFEELFSSGPGCPRLPG